MNGSESEQILDDNYLYKVVFHIAGSKNWKMILA